MIRIPVWVVVLAAVSVPSLMWAADVVIPHVFTPGTTIRAAEVNENFEALRSEMSKIARFEVVGASTVKVFPGDPEPTSVYVTRLDNVLLNGNPDAMVWVSIKSVYAYGSCTLYLGHGEVYYENGYWWVFSTCPGAKYNILASDGKG